MKPNSFYLVTVKGTLIQIDSVDIERVKENKFFGVIIDGKINQKSLMSNMYTINILEALQY